MTIQARMAIIISTALLMSCAQIAGDQKPPALKGSNDVYYGTEVVLGPCGDGPESAILVSLVAAVVAQGVNRIGDALKAAANRDMSVALARRSIELRANNDGKFPVACVTIVRGWFHRTPIDSSGKSRQAPDLKQQDGSAWAAISGKTRPADLWQKGLYVAASPDFYFQGFFVPSSDKSAAAIMPVVATLDEPMLHNALRPNKRRHVLLAFSLGEKAVDLEKGGGTTMILGAMEPGQPLIFRTFTSGVISDNDSCASSLPVEGGKRYFDCPKDDKDTTLIQRASYLSDWFSLPLPKQLNPCISRQWFPKPEMPHNFSIL